MGQIVFTINNIKSKIRVMTQTRGIPRRRIFVLRAAEKAFNKLRILAFT